MKTPRTLVATAAAIAAVLCAGSAFAQQTIDHNKALAGNVTPGDAPGYPITLSQPGHYKLMSNLVVPATTVGVTITAPNVTLDLNGFTIAGPETCTRNASTAVVSCSNSPYQDRSGVYVEYTGRGFLVRNGTIQGFAGNGLKASPGVPGGAIEDLTVRMNTADGVYIATTSPRPFRVSRLTAELNGWSGLSSSMAMVDASILSMNGSHGVFGDGLTLLTNSQATHNKGIGINSATVRGTQSVSNAGGNKASVTSLGGNIADGGVY